MSFSSIAIKQREREEDTLRSFITFSLIGSLGIHLVVLSFGNYWSRTSELEDKPIEFLVVESPVQAPKPKAVESPVQAPKPKVVESPVQVPEPQEAKSEDVSALRSSGAKDSSDISDKLVQQPRPASVKTKKSTLNIPQSAPPAITEKQPTPITTRPPQKLIENLNQEPIRKQEPAQKPLPPQVAPVQTSLPEMPAKPKPVAPPLSRILTSPVPSPQSIPLKESFTAPLNETGINTTRPSSTQNLGQPSGRVDSKVPNNSSTTNNSTPTSSQANDKEPGTAALATGSGTARQGARSEGNGNSASTGSGSGRLTCRKCGKPRYPENARRQGLEGTAELSVDVDASGNVTNVRLVRSSGHSELDEAALKEAKRWKFNAPAGEKQGIPAKVSFNMER